MVVLAGALTGALLVRQHNVRAAPPVRPPSGAVSVTCADGRCQLLASNTAGESVVQLYADARGTDGRLKFVGAGGSSVFDTDISQAGVRLDGSSLSCVSGTVPACLVSGEYPDTGDRAGELAEVFVQRGGYWQLPAAAVPMYSGAAAFTLVAAGEDGDPMVIGVENDCGGTTVEDHAGHCERPFLVVQVFAVDGTSQGCTRPATSLTLLPGKGTQPPPSYDLHECPASAG